MKVSENRILRIYVPKREKLTLGRRNCIIRSFISLCCWASRARMIQNQEDGMDSSCVPEICKMHGSVCICSQKRIVNMVELHMGGRIILVGYKKCR